MLESDISIGEKEDLSWQQGTPNKMTPVKITSLAVLYFAETLRTANKTERLYVLFLEGNFPFEALLWENLTFEGIFCLEESLV